ncbi:hypothetical protein MINS_23180 [Mycolicibacterium insubricum]|uniref:DUF2510 domain-containing protein n=2 Tax=Mycolicibacterium insubricum TaxID=444597 RepID=UPI0010547754|nr:DUF2510 domain-containing protein [Mycolicibacterium insubricum]BBZ66889.1 hypothetical protein MINS_23180 [Mycolicibacterium insubricum]
MTTELPAGWYRDARGAQSYWDGHQWNTPAPPSAPPGPAPGAPPTYGPPPAAGPPPASSGDVTQAVGVPMPAAVNQAAAALRSMGVSKAMLPAGLIYGGLVFALLSLFMRWTTVSADIPLIGSMNIDASPFKTVWMVLPLLLIAAGSWLAWPLLARRPVPMKRLAGLVGVAAGLVVCWLIGLINYFNGASSAASGLGDDSDADINSMIEVSINFGFILFTLAVAALIAGVVGLWRDRRVTAIPTVPSAPAAPPPPHGPGPLGPPPYGPAPRA